MKLLWAQIRKHRVLELSLSVYSLATLTTQWQSTASHLQFLSNQISRSLGFRPIKYKHNTNNWLIHEIFLGYKYNESVRLMSK